MQESRASREQSARGASGDARRALAIDLSGAGNEYRSSAGGRSKKAAPFDAR